MGAAALASALPVVISWLYARNGESKGVVSTVTYLIFVFLLAFPIGLIFSGAIDYVFSRTDIFPLLLLQTAFYIFAARSLLQMPER
jgi:hypothetical protein